MNQNVPKLYLFAQILGVDFPVVCWIFDYWIFQNDPSPRGAMEGQPQLSRSEGPPNGIFCPWVRGAGLGLDPGGNFVSRRRRRRRHPGIQKSKKSENPGFWTKIYEIQV